MDDGFTQKIQYRGMSCLPSHSHLFPALSDLHRPTSFCPITTVRATTPGAVTRNSTYKSDIIIHHTHIYPSRQKKHTHIDPFYVIFLFDYKNRWYICSAVDFVKRPLMFPCINSFLT